MITEAKFLTKAIADIDSFPYILEEPIVYQTIILNCEITVPIGFSTDLYSIPWWLHWALPRDEGHANAAAIVHDDLYRYGMVNGVLITRLQADMILREAMKAKQLAAWRIWVIYRGVRLGGCKPWNDYRKRSFV